MYKNTASQKVACFAWDGASGAAKTGDAANISAQISKDGAACAATNDAAPTELDAADAPGIYIFDLEQAETNADMVVIAPVSSTADVIIRPIITYTVAAIDVGTTTIEGAITLQAALSTILAALAGKVTGGGTDEITHRNQADDTDRLVMSVDTQGNRTSTTIDVSDL